MMDALSGVAMALLQDSSLEGLQHDVHLQMIFIGIISVIVLLCFLAVVVAGLMALKYVRKAEELADRVEGKVTPLVDKAHALVTELTPKVRSITENVEQISYTVRGKVDEFGATASEINKTVLDVNSRTKTQVSHVDQMVTEALNTAHGVSRTVQDGVRKPVQQIAGIVAGVRAGLETLIQRSPFMHRGPKATAERTTVYETTTTTAYERTPDAAEPASPYAQAGTPYKRTRM